MTKSMLVLMAIWIHSKCRFSNLAYIPKPFILQYNILLGCAI